VITELRVEGALARYAHVDAVEVRPPSGNSTVRVYHFDEEADADAKESPKEKKGRHHRERPTGFFDAKGHQPYHGGWRSPVPGARISSRFNPTRLHPVLHVVMPHNGIDFAAPTGAKVYASAAGSVVMAGNGGPCGNMVQIEHPGGLVTAYCHLSKFAAGLHAGQHVDTRQLIGYVGATGRVTGPHLHFALKKDQKFVDPMTLKMDGVRVLPARDREAFAAARALLDGALDAVALPASVGPTDAGTKDEEVFDDGDDESDAGKIDSGSP
jgi:murein DD-endopeptidase MepM/ murein hydrolase activator NlpD